MSEKHEEQIHWEHITADSVVQALLRINANGFPAGRKSIVYFLEANGKKYPPKYVVGLAYEIATGKSLRPSQFGAGEGRANERLRKLGFVINAHA